MLACIWLLEFSLVKALFHESFAHMPAYTGVKFTVTQIEKVHNARLLEQFHRSMKHFYLNNFGCEIVRVFHGTPPYNIPSILQENLSMKDRGDRDSGWFGAGVYLSQHADYILAYCNDLVAPFRPGQSGQILVFDTLPGRKYICDGIKNGQARMADFDCHISPEGYEQVMFDERHILPTHVISFSAQVAPGAKYDFSIERHGGGKQPAAASQSSAIGGLEPNTDE